VNLKPASRPFAFQLAGCARLGVFGVQGASVQKDCTGEMPVFLSMADAPPEGVAKTQTLESNCSDFVVVPSRANEFKPITTLNNGYLGSRNDAERSEMRYVMRIAEFRESSSF